MLLLFQCIVKCRLDKDTILPVPAHRLYPMFTIFGSHKNNHIVVVPATVAVTQTLPYPGVVSMPGQNVLELRQQLVFGPSICDCAFKEYKQTSEVGPRGTCVRIYSSLLSDPSNNTSEPTTVLSAS